MADLLDRLTDTIRSGAIGKATKRSARWFQDKIKGLKGGLRNRFSTTNPDKFYRESDNKINPNLLSRRANLGSLYCYHYDPKYKEEEVKSFLQEIGGTEIEVLRDEN